MQIIFVLVESEDARNVGAAARALHTMGHSHLRLVRPKCDHLSGAAKALAHGSQHLLESAQVYSSLTEATSDCQLKCATTARHRQEKLLYMSSRDLLDYLVERQEHINKFALIFGGETSGLCNSDIDLCELVSTVPLAYLQPSINLAQSVMLYSYALAAPDLPVQTTDKRLAELTLEAEHYQALSNATQQLLELLNADEKLQRDTLRAIARLAPADLFLVHRLRRKVEAALAINSVSHK